jgi:hypothetical protein
MKLNRWLVASAIVAVAAVGTGVQGGLFDRLRDRSDDAALIDKQTPAVSFAIADARDIGKIVSPVSYQALPAPGADSDLVPVPEGVPVPGSVRSYPPAEPYVLPSMPVPGMTSAGFAPGAPGYPIGPAIGAEGFPLFPRVKYEDRHHIHPCATPTIVQVLDPCTDTGRRGLFRHHRQVVDCDACGPQCVYVEICVPPGCPKVKVERSGRKVKYDYGDYKVEVTSKDGYVEVDYDD